MHNKSENLFSLKNSSKAFEERQKNVFEQLTKLQCNLRNDEKIEVDQGPPTKKTRRSVTRPFRGKESIFKVPKGPVNYMKTIPDFKKNPHKWTKYSLADVKDEDMSETSNTRAALSFLNGLKSVEDVNTTSGESKKIVFTKVQESPLETKEETRPSFRGSKMVMPEYVVGQKFKKEKKNQKLRNTDTSHLKLDHLYEDD